MANQRGRPRKDEPRSKQLPLRVTAREFEIVRATAALNEKSRAGWVYAVLSERIAAEAADPLVQEQAELFARRDAREGQVKRLGSERRRGRAGEKKSGGERRRSAGSD